MKSIREPNPHKPVASFYFPDNNCGPDIVFALESKEGSEPPILCVLQVSSRPNAEANSLLTFVLLKAENWRCGRHGESDRDDKFMDVL